MLWDTHIFEVDQARKYLDICFMSHNNKGCFIFMGLFLHMTSEFHRNFVLNSLYDHVVSHNTFHRHSMAYDPIQVCAKLVFLQSSW